MNPAATRTPRVVMLGWSSDPHIGGGVGVACRALSEGLRELGCDIVMQTLAPSRPAAAVHDDRETCPVIPLPYLSGAVITGHRRVPPDLKPMVEPEPARLPENATRITEWVMSGGPSPDDMTAMEPDLIHAHDWMTFPAAQAAAEAADIPLVLHVHSTEFERSPGRIDTDIAEIEGNGLRAADLVVAVSHRTADVLTARYNVDPDRVAVIPPSAPLSAIPAKTARFPEFTVLFLGRIVDHKGPFFFYEAATRLLSEDRNWRFIVAGDGDRLSALIDQAATDGVSDRIHFTGWVSEAEREHLFQMADVFLAPAVSEPFGLVALEATRAGLPILVSSQSGISELLPKELKLDYWDISLICERLRRMREDPEAAAEAAAAGALALAELTPMGSAIAVARFYSRLTGGNR